MSTTEKQAAHAHKVAQKVADYHSKMATTTHQLIDNPSADIGIFKKLAPELCNKIYASFFEDIFQPDPSDTPCPCRCVPAISGEHDCEHTGSNVYKPLSHLRPLLSIAATCKLFRTETQALLFVDYVPHTAWVVRGEQGVADMKQFLRSIRPEDRTKVQFGWRLDNVFPHSVFFGASSLKAMNTNVAEWIVRAINRHDGQDSSSQNGTAHPLGGAALYTHVITTRRFYYSKTTFTNGTGTVVVNRPLQVIFWKVWQQEDWEKESDQRYQRIISM
jgi:hypothetical protein